MAISNDSFGSPGLGEGIGLQGTLKDYTPLIAKSRLAEQAMASKAAQKKLDAELKDQEEALSEMKRFKVVGKLPALTMERQRISSDVINTYKALRKKGEPISGNIEWEKKLMDAQERFNQLDFIEDAYIPGINKIASKDVNYDEVELNEPLLAALKNPDEKDYLRLTGGKFTVGEPLLKEYPKVNINKYAKEITDRLSRSVTVGEDEIKQYQGINDKAAFVQQTINKKYDPKAVEDAVNSFANSSEMYMYLDREQRRANRLGFNFDRNAELERQKNLLRADLKDEQYKKLIGIYESKDYKTSGLGGLKSKLSLSMDVYPKEQLSRQFSDFYFTKLMDDFKNSPESQMMGEEYNIKPDNTPDEVLEKINNYLKSTRNPSSKISSWLKDLTGVEKLGGNVPTLTRDAIYEIAMKEFKDDPNAKYFGAKDNAENKEFKLIEKAGQPPISGIPRGITKVGNEYKFIVDKKVGKKYKRITIPLEQNAATLAVDWLQNDKATKEDWIALYEGKEIEKKAEGGLIEPKTVSQKFHNKSKNMTKFVYSDGSEEIFNGIL